MSEMIVSIVCIIGGLLLMIAIIALPIVAAVARQNSRRRRFTRELAEEFNLTADLDEGSRLTKATVSARGAIEKLGVTVRTNTSGTRVHGGPMTSMRVEIGELTVRAAQGPEGGRLISNAGAAREEGTTYRVSATLTECEQYAAASFEERYALLFDGASLPESIDAYVAPLTNLSAHTLSEGCEMRAIGPVNTGMYGTVFNFGETGAAIGWGVWNDVPWGPCSQFEYSGGTAPSFSRYTLVSVPCETAVRCVLEEAVEGVHCPWTAPGRARPVQKLTAVRDGSNGERRHRPPETRARRGSVVATHHHGRWRRAVLQCLDRRHEWCSQSTPASQESPMQVKIAWTRSVAIRTPADCSSQRLVQQ